MNKNRVRTLKERPVEKGPVVYWMSRDQRVRDNWALLWAQCLALNQRAPIAVTFCLAPEFLNATQRQYGFMLAGLREVESNLAKKVFPFSSSSGNLNRL